MKKNAKKLEALLKKSVENCVTDNCALYYSGGIDSSLIATFFDFKHKLRYEDDNYAEEFKAKFPLIMKVIGEPIYSFSPFAWWKLGEQAKKLGVDTVISGEGADELFWGYIRYIPIALFEQARKKFPSYKAMFPIKMTVPELAEYEFKNSLPKLIEAEIKIANHFGLQIKFPFMDEEIIKFASTLPYKDKISSFTTKNILRMILKERNPRWEDIEKRGLFCSVNKWIGSDNGYGKDDYIKLQEAILYGED